MLHDFKIYFYVNSYADKLFGKRKRVGYFVTMCLVVCRYDGCGTAVKGNDNSWWSSADVVLWLGMRYNRDTIKWWWEWLRLIWHFNSSGGWESTCTWRVTSSGGLDSMLWFWLERGGDWMKCYRKMKRRQRARLRSIGKKRDTMRRRCRPKEKRHRGGEREEMTPIGLTWILLGQK
jgi:hypothetical protein